MEDGEVPEEHKAMPIIPENNHSSNGSVGNLEAAAQEVRSDGSFGV